LAIVPIYSIYEGVKIALSQGVNFGLTFPMIVHPPKKSYVPNIPIAVKVAIAPVQLDTAHIAYIELPSTGRKDVARILASQLSKEIVAYTKKTKIFSDIVPIPEDALPTSPTIPELIQAGREMDTDLVLVTKIVEFEGQLNYGFKPAIVEKMILELISYETSTGLSVWHNKESVNIKRHEPLSNMPEGEIEFQYFHLSTKEALPMVLAALFPKFYEDMAGYKPTAEKVAIADLGADLDRVENLSVKKRAKTFAVVIGISDYRDTRIPCLRYASNDAKSFYKWLISPNGGRYAPANVRVLIDQNASYRDIRDALFVWLEQALEEDVVTIYFAGHGSPNSPDSPDNLFLLPYDVQYDSIATTGFPMWDIETALKRFIKARKVIVIADACHAGGVGQSFDIARRANRGIKINPISTGLQKLSKVGDGVCIISASDDNQFSQESEKWGGGHGVFTYFLLQGLNGEADYNNNNNVSLGELIPYLSEQVRMATRNAQSPTVAGKFDPALSIGR